MKQENASFFKESDSLNKQEKDFFQKNPLEKRIGGIKYRLRTSSQDEEALRNLVRFERPIWQEVSDDDLLHQVCEKVFDLKFLENGDVDIVIKNGFVSIEGEVTNRECKKIIEEIILNIPGVINVQNNLIVRDVY